MNVAASMGLSAHHQDLERSFEELLVQAEGGDPIALRTRWDSFEKELLRHMEIEEREILPGFARDNPAEAAAIRAEHESLRAALAELGLRLDLHALRADAVAHFIAQLRTHARREERVLYDWAQRQPPARGWQRIREELARLRAQIGASPPPHAETSAHPRRS
jgi:hemerythrin-like domain-containing protein